MCSFTKKVYNFFCTISESEQSHLKPCPHYFLKLVFKTSIKTSIIYIHIYNIIYIYIHQVQPILVSQFLQYIKRSPARVHLLLLFSWIYSTYESFLISKTFMSYLPIEGLINKAYSQKQKYWRYSKQKFSNRCLFLVKLVTLDCLYGLFVYMDCLDCLKCHILAT